MEKVRVRFAPSPTGPLHIGGVRTALFNYLFAKKHNGTFILRIEDTDQTRYVANAEKYIVDSLEWCNILFDEGPGKNEKFGPYRQSERKEIYKKYAQELINNDKAYYAFDSAEELDTLRKEAEENKTIFVYNNQTRKSLQNSINLSKEIVAQKIMAGEKYVIRFKTPEDKTLELNDIIRGSIKVETNTLDDKILFKSDGMPTYHLANIVDDHLMEISHVIRGEEWLPSMPLHVMLYEAFGWDAPKFAHLPLILKPEGKGKLSKRDGDKHGFPVFPLAYENDITKEISRGYKEDGYLPDAFINMLALLGWNPGTEQEIFSLKALCNEFSLERVSKSGAKFNPEKTKWFNQQYLQSKTNKEITELYIEKFGNENKEIEYLEKVFELVKERAIFIDDLKNLANYFFNAPTEYDTNAIKKQWKEETPTILQGIIPVIENINDFKSINIENIIKEYLMANELGFGKVMPPLRLAIVGSLQGPHLFDIIEMIGKEESILRIENIINSLK